MGHPNATLRLGAPTASGDGKYRFRYPAGDWPGVPGSASGAGKTDAASAPAGSADGGGGDSWQLAPGHYETAKIPLEIIAPRPSLTVANAYYRAYPGMPYRWPVGVLGGAAPFHFEVLTGPVGLAVGANYGDSDYGILSWPNPTTSGSPHSVTVKVTDQEGDSTTVSWTITVSTSGWIFVDAANGHHSPSNGGSATGTISDPFLEPDDFYVAKNDTTYSSADAVVFRAGTYALNRMPIEDSTRITFTGAKPSIFMAYPGESATFDMTDVHFNFEGGNHFAVAGIRFSNIGIGASALPKCVVWSGGYSNVLVYANTFDDQPSSPSGENPSLLFASNPGDTPGNYTLISHNTFSGAKGKDLFLGYYAYKGVAEWNSIANSTGPGFYLKLNFSQWSVRFNTGLSGNTGESMLRVDTYSTATDVEACFNNYKGTQAGILVGYEAGAASVYDYRNTWNVTAQEVDNSTGSWESTRNVIRHSASYNATHGWRYLVSGSEVSEASASLTPTRTQNLDGSSGLIDTSTGLLTGTDRTNYLGIRGHEIA